MQSENRNVFENAMDDPRVTAYIFGQLEGDERLAFEQILETYAAYRDAVEKTKQVAMLLEQDASSDLADAPSLSEVRTRTLETAMQQIVSTETGKFVSVHRNGAGWLGLAAALASAAALVAVLLWSGQRPDTVAELDAIAQANEALQTEREELEQILSGESAARRVKQNNDENPREENAGQVVTSQTSPESPQAADLADSNIDTLKNLPAVQLQNALPFSRAADAMVNRYGTETLNERMVVSEPTPTRPAPIAPAPPGRMMGMGGMGGAFGGMAGDFGRSDNLSVEVGSVGQAPDGFGDQVLAAEYRAKYGPEHPMTRRFSERERDDFENLLGPTVMPDGDAHAEITDNAFQYVKDHPLSTFSIDVDTASYSKVRMILQQYNRSPPANAVRIEELLNYFEYDYQGPEDSGDQVPFAANMEVAACPWNANHKLARIAIKGKEVANQERAVSNLVFLLDVSGSMNEPNKLPLVRRGMEMLVGQLGENDRVAIVVYAGAAGLVLDSTTADNKEVIFDALDRLQAGGSTNGGQGIQLAYQVARDHFIKGGTNRVILCSDGDFNVGTTGTDQLVNLVEQEAKAGVFLTVLGFGTGNLNDAMLEAISGRGDGNYAFIDTSTEAHKVLVEQLTGTLVTIAKDVKIQIEFNPALVDSYRLIGYENRVLAAKDFADDTKDAGEIGAGHTVTALYEIVPAGTAQPDVGELKYQLPKEEPAVIETANPYPDELLTLKLRYKEPEGGASKLLEFPIKDASTAIEDSSLDFRFAAAVAGFGMLLRNSPHRGDISFEAVRKLARSSIGSDKQGLRAEFLGLIDIASQHQNHSRR